MKKDIIGYMCIVLISMLICASLILISRKAQAPKAKEVAPTTTPTITPTTKPTVAPTKKPRRKKKKRGRLKTFKLTAYCPCQECSEGYGRSTATGARARANHTIAVDPNVIKYGTKVVINGVTYTAEDCGGGVKGNHIDIFFNTHAEVERFGVKYKKVKIGE